MKFLDGKSMICPYETEISRDIRILSEVEKVWIIFDLDNSGSLNKDEIKEYIVQMAGPVLTLTDEQIDEMYHLIDTDNNGSIDKQEMEIFLRAMLSMQEDLTFNQQPSNNWLDHKTKK